MKLSKNKRNNNLLSFEKNKVKYPISKSPNGIIE